MPVADRRRVSTSVSGWMPSNFTPARFRPVLWLDAVDASSITSSSGKVSQWNDISGNSRNATQATSANQPSTGTDTIGGLNALTFGTSTWLTTPAYTPPASGFTTFVVANQTTAGTGYMWEQSGGGGTDVSSRRYLWRNSNSSLFFGYHDGSTFRDYTTSYPASIGARVLIGAVIGTRISVSHAASDTTSSESWATRTGYPTSASRAITVGNAGSTTASWNGTIGELLIYDAELTFAERRLVADYLRIKWGL